MKSKKESTVLDEGKIRDKWLFLFVYPALALLAVHFGNDNALVKLLGMPSYYTDILFALVCVYGCGCYIKWISSWIYKRPGLDKNLTRALKYHLVLGLLVPALFVVCAEWIYLTVLGIRISASSIFYLELPLTILLCLLINMTYLFMYFRTKTPKTWEKEIQKRSFAAKEGHHTINIPMSEVAYFVKRNKFTFLITKKGGDYLYDQPFKTIWKALPAPDFFQLNRQIISSRESIVQCTKTKTRRLKVKLSPSTDEAVYVAKVNATKFLKWLDNS